MENEDEDRYSIDLESIAADDHDGDVLSQMMTDSIIHHLVSEREPMLKGGTDGQREEGEEEEEEEEEDIKRRRRRRKKALIGMAKTFAYNLSVISFLVLAICSLIVVVWLMKVYRR